MWNIQNSTIIPPAAHGHLKIHMAALSPFVLASAMRPQPTNHQGRTREPHTPGLCGASRLRAQKRPMHAVCSPSHYVTHLASMRAGDCRGAVTRHRLFLNHIATVRSRLTAAPQAISPVCMQAARHVFVFMTASLDRFEPACPQRRGDCTR